MSMVGRWNYEGLSDVCFGEEIVYRKAAEFFGDSCEDWGCGTGWMRYYIKDYKGIDGSLSEFIKEPTDLTEYTSNTDNIMIRQVLEQEPEWRKILENAVKSFQKKLFIGIHSPFGEETKVHEIDELGMPTLSFTMSDITDYLKDFKVRTEVVPTNFEYGEETLFYVER